MFSDATFKSRTTLRAVAPHLSVAFTALTTLTLLAACGEKKEAYTGGLRTAPSVEAPLSETPKQTVSEGTEGPSLSAEPTGSAGASAGATAGASVATSADSDDAVESVADLRKRLPPRSGPPLHRPIPPAKSASTGSDSSKGGELILPSPGGPEDFTANANSTTTPAPLAVDAPKDVTSASPLSLPEPPPVVTSVITPLNTSLGSSKKGSSISESSTSTSDSSRTDSSATSSREPALRGYTTSAGDELASYFTQTQSSTFKMAKNILSASLRREQAGGSYQMTLRLRVRDGGGEKTYSFSGSAYARSVSELSVTSQDRRGPLAKIKCMDSNGSCETSVVQVDFGSNGKSDSVYLIFREASADLYFTLPGKRSQNPEYATMRRWAIDSIQENQTQARVQDAILKTYEVIGGRAGFEVQILSFDEEMMAFTGPLAAATGDAALNIPVTMAHVKGYRSTLQDTLGRAVLIANDGRGKIELAATMRKVEGYAQDTFKIRVTRKLNAVVPVGEDTFR